MEHGQETMTVVDEHGVEHVCEVIFTFESEEFGKSYVLYHVLGEEDRTMKMKKLKFMLPLSSHQKITKTENFCRLKTDEEWDMIEEMLNTFLAEDEDEEIIHMCTDGMVQAVPFFSLS